MTHPRRPSKSGGLGVLGVLAVLGSYALARISPRLGTNHLIASLGSDYESPRMAAYMALTKLGPRSAPRLLAAIERGHPESVALIEILGGQGDPSQIPKLEELATSERTEIARAAVGSLEMLQEDVDP